MDGQALDLPTAAFSIFPQFFLFLDWRVGLSKMARVVALGTLGIIVGIGTAPAPTYYCQRRSPPSFPSWRGRHCRPVSKSSVTRSAAAAMKRVGFCEVVVTPVTADFVPYRAMLDTLDGLFGFSPLWKSLAPGRQARVVEHIRERGDDNLLRIPPTALIATGRR